MKTKIKCLVTKKYVCLFIFSDITDVVDEKEKSKPSNKRNANKNKICLSMFLHHFANKPVFSLPKLNIKYFFKFFRNKIFEIITSIFKITKLIKRCSSWTKQNCWF